MSNIYLISPEAVRRDSVIDDNVDDQFILVAIKDAQMSLMENIGKTNYKKIEDAVGNREKMTEKIKTLLDDYIHPFLCYKVSETIAIPLSYKYREQGVVQASDQHYVQTSSMKDLTYVAKHYGVQADMYLHRIFTYICENPDEFDTCCVNFKKSASSFFFRK